MYSNQKTFAGKQPIIKLNNDFIDNISNKSYSEIESELVDMRTQSAVSDIFNGLSKDKIKKYKKE